MTYLWSGEKNLVGRLRIRSTSSDSWALRLRTFNILNSARLSLPRLCPSAVLCVRKLRDPLPRSLNLSHDNVSPPPEWEQALAASLDRLARSASRPALGDVPANAEAVLFVDQSELLFCLAADWCGGTAITRWWWQGLFNRQDIGRALLQAWLEAPEYVPAALEKLALRSTVLPFVTDLPLADIQAVLQKVIRAFALNDLANAVEGYVPGMHNGDINRALTDQGVAANPPPRLSGWSESAANRTCQMQQPGGPNYQMPAMRDGIKPARSPSDRRAPPWHPWVREIDGAPRPAEIELLVVVGLMLCRNPAVLRAWPFAREVAAWYESVEPGPIRLESSPALAGAWTDGEQKPGAAVDEFVPGPTTPSVNRTSSFRRAREPEADVPGRPAAAPANAEQLLIDDSIRKTPRDAAGSKPSTRAENPSDLPTAQSDLGVGISSTADRNDVISEAPVDRLTEATLQTELGGVFYLVNLGLFLNLYGDFTSPSAPGIPLPLWDFLTLVGNQILGGQAQPDPVWPLLAALSRRGETQPPGAGFDSPDEWRLPEEWLTPFSSEGIWKWSTAAGRLRVNHPEGFRVLDLPPEQSDSGSVLAREMKSYARGISGRLQRRALPHEVYAASGPGRWLGWLMPYARARLKLALGLATEADIPGVLIRHHARVILTAVHLDVVFDLSELPISIRLAGLDRNPGWVPAAGRFITFHFD